jgi:hypothetical protein
VTLHRTLPTFYLATGTYLIKVAHIYHLSLIPSSLPKPATSAGSGLFWPGLLLPQATTQEDPYLDAFHVTVTITYLTKALAALRVAACSL